MRKFPSFVLVLALWLLPVPAATATENAFGRYIPGMFAGPASEIVPPVPGMYFQSSTFYYSGSASKSMRVPIGRTLHSGLDVDFFSTALSAIWVPEWSPAEGARVALGLTLPVEVLGITAHLGRFSHTDHSSGLGDIAITPAIGWQSGPHLFSTNLTIYLPTGPYDKNDLANIGLNCWTFTPSVAYTYVNPAYHIDFSFAGGVDINTENPDTNYRSGAMAHGDATLLRTFENGFGMGVFGSVLYQISDDQGELADRLNGFRGRSFAVGPMIKYSAPGLHGFAVNLNWAPEFEVKNRTEGNAFYLNMTAKF